MKQEIRHQVILNTLDSRGYASIEALAEDAIRKEFVELCASLFARGYCVGGAGNVSQRLPDESLLISPKGSCLGRLDSVELSKADMDGKHLSGREPTIELPFHIEVYKARPDCQAVVHLHSTYATAISCLADLDMEDALRPFTPYYVMKVGKLPVAPYYRPGSLELAATVGETARKSPTFLLANHGTVVCGDSLVDAVNRAEELEETAKLHFLLLSSGKSVRYFTSQEIAELTAASGRK